MVVAISLNQWQHAGEGDRHRGAPARDGARLRRRLHARKPTATARATASPRCSSRGSRRARSTRCARRSTSTACAGVRTRRSRSCSTTTGGRRADEPGVRRRRPSRHRHRCARRRRRCGSRPNRRSHPRRRRCSARTPTRCSPTCSASPPPRSGAARRRRRRQRGRARMTAGAEPTLADAGFADARPRPDAARAGGAARGVPRRRSRGARPRARSPRSGTGRCFRPEVPTAALGRDGHPRRRAEMDEFPQRMWVGGRVRVTRPLRIGVDAERVSRDRERPT